MKKLLLISALLFSNVLFAKTIEYKIEKEESGKSTKVLTFQINENEKKYYHKEVNLVEGDYPIFVFENGIKKKKYNRLSIENYLEIKVSEENLEFKFKDEKQPEISVPRTVESSADIQFDLKNVNKERKSMLKVDDIEFFISATEK